MSAKNQVSNQSERVKVARVRTGGEVAMPLVSLTNVVNSPLAVRPARQSQLERSEKVSAIPQIRISLHDGAVEVNGRSVRLPIGLSGTMSARELKNFADIYRGDALFIRSRGGLQRVRDSQMVEVVDGAKFTHKKEQPVRVSPSLRSLSRPSRD